jgi:enterochelin esterase-like enzyme
MNPRRLLTVLAFGSVALIVFGSVAGAVVGHRSSAHHRPRPPSPARTLSVVCRSAALGGTMPTLVYLPSGYASGRRYAVVYFLHGLPGSPASYQQNAFVAAALASAGEKAIVVAPQGARDVGSDREYLDWDAAEDWPQAISHDLPACIDSRFHTIAGRYGRALVGLSAGGYGAMNIGLRNLDQFGAVQSWSGYFVATNPAGTKVLDLGSAQANAAATVPRGPELKSRVQSLPTQIAFYVGLQDDRFLTMNRRYDAALRRTGIAHVFHTYPGGHSVTLWRSQAPTWLGWALHYLAAGRVRRPHAAR